MTEPLLPAHLDHRRSYEDFYYVYPVVSRRSKGVSIGINLNPDKVCNFDCAYCEVDRITPARVKTVNLGVLEQELREMIRIYQNGKLFEHEPFASVDADRRRLNDIAFSGDGEPTTYKFFDLAVGIVNQVRLDSQLDPVKLVLITDATGLNRPAVRRGLDLMSRVPHEIWAKLDAGTEPYYKLINRSRIPFERVLESILECAKAFPLFIQTLFTRVNGQPIPEAEVQAYIERVKHIQANGGNLLGIQLYTIARPTPETWITALSAKEIDSIAAAIRAQLPALPVEVFYGN